MGKRIRQVLVIGMFFAFALQPISSYASEMEERESTVVKASEANVSFSGIGEGTKNNPYQITNATQLNEI